MVLSEISRAVTQQFVPVLPAFVLILDNNPLDRLWLQRLCAQTELPVDIETVSNLIDFKERLRRNHVDFAIMDASLPSQSKVQATRFLSAQSNRRRTAGVWVTGDLVETSGSHSGYPILSKDSLCAEVLRVFLTSALDGLGAVCPPLGRDSSTRVSASNNVSVPLLH